MLEGMCVSIHIVSVSSGRRKDLDALSPKFGLQTRAIAENILNILNNRQKTVLCLGVCARS